MGMRRPRPRPIRHDVSASYTFPQFSTDAFSLNLVRHLSIQSEVEISLFQILLMGYRGSSRAQSCPESRAVEGNGTHSMIRGKEERKEEKYPK